MNEEERNELYESTGIAAQASQHANQAASTQYYLDEQQRSLAEIQLEVDTIITKCYHLLRQDKIVIQNNDEISSQWQDISDESQRTLTDWGVDRIMQVIHFYINKNTLLSNFDDVQINRIMLRFCIELNDLILLKYQTLFRRPSFEECQQILKDRLNDQAKLKAFAKEIASGVPTTPQEMQKINTSLIKDIERRIEYEINKIKGEKTRENLREYGLIVAQLETIVFSTLNRAYKGEERGSIRRHTNISEILGGRPQAAAKQELGRGIWMAR